jgi:hypothetical protein
LTGGCFGARDEAAIGNERLDSGDAVEVMDLIEEHQSEDLPHARVRGQAVEGLGLVRRGGADEIQRQVSPQTVVGVDPRELHRHAVLDDGLTTRSSRYGARA